MNISDLDSDQQEAAVYAEAVQIPPGYTHATILHTNEGPRIVATALNLPAMVYHGPGCWRRLVQFDGEKH